MKENNTAITDLLDKSTRSSHCFSTYKPDLSVQVKQMAEHTVHIKPRHSRLRQKSWPIQILLHTKLHSGQTSHTNLACSCAKEGEALWILTWLLYLCFFLTLLHSTTMHVRSPVWLILHHQLCSRGPLPGHRARLSYQ